MKQILLIAPALALAACAPTATYSGPSLASLATATATINGEAVVATALGGEGWVIERPEYKLTVSPEPNRPNIKGFSFVLFNTSAQTIKVMWDDSVLSIGSIPSPVYHLGVKYIDASASKPASVLPAGGNLVEAAYPANLLTYSGGRYGVGWLEGTFFSKPKSGDRASLLLALDVGGSRQNVTFTMTIN